MQYQKDNPNWLIAETMLGSVSVVSAQTSFMASQLHDEALKIDGPFNGIVSDAAHGWWRVRNSLLLVISVFCQTLLAWVPVLIPVAPLPGAHSTPSDIPAASSEPVSGAISSTTVKKGKRLKQLPGTPKKKPGNKGGFPKGHFAFMLPKIQPYLIEKEPKVRKAAKAAFLQAYFEEFPWHTGSRPPDVNYMDPASTPTDESVEDDPGYGLPTEPERIISRRNAHQNEIFVSANGQLKNWVYHETQKKMRKDGVFSAISTQLAYTGPKTVPRLMPDYKYWMSHQDHKERFQDVFSDLTKHNKPDSKERMKLICQEHLVVFLQPMLDAIRAHTGLSVPLLAGAPAEAGDFDLMIVSSGTVDGKKFENWNETSFVKDIVNNFLLFVDAGRDDPQANQNGLASTGQPDSSTSTPIIHLKFNRLWASVSHCLAA
ncbi:hypothetical protein BDP27DRAFT_1453400 [Rhodocollybia butyracea]|uniref:Uncharacterized protein n=1 Tax=Rhodocollybia butyracea TaxID=206335 RepID=A0A9P5TYH3_9AGAR|nr:hypothetical protein BDP27DRAFT_1453400 [Rhodocollybia butyracea]